jgi:hypothetical protein
LGEGETSATIKESGENADMGRTKPVVEGDAAHHSPCSIKKARLEKQCGPGAPARAARDLVRAIN